MQKRMTPNPYPPDAASTPTETKPTIPVEAYPGESQYRGKWQFNVTTNPTPTELAMIAAPLLAAAIVNASAQSHGIRNSLEVALALWQEARRVLQEAQTTPNTPRPGGG